MIEHDKWSRWLTEHRFGGSIDNFERAMRSLRPVRDKIITAAEIVEGNTVLDVGTGDGLLGFAALGHVGTSGQVIFSDISPAAIELCQQAYDPMCGPPARFVAEPANALQSVADCSVDAIVCRAALMYAEERAESFAELFRVLRPGGRLSICEPVNRRAVLARDRSQGQILFGYDIAPLGKVAEKLFEHYGFPKDVNADVITNFDEQDLFNNCEDVGFAEVAIELRMVMTSYARYPNFEFLWKYSPNPLTPTLQEASESVLTPDEQQALIAFLEPLVASTPHRRYNAQCYLVARKDDPAA
jgi:ubiquinone/menaquinone biosynthesis C-methylase UbiE